MPERTNYFLLLELDPSVTEWPAIERRIQEKRRTWSLEKTQGIPAVRRKAEYNLGLIREIEDTLKNPETRFQEAKNAAKQREQEREVHRQKKNESLEGMISLLKAQGQCPQEQILVIVKKMEGSFTEQEVTDLVMRAGIPIVKSEKSNAAKLSVKERLDPVTVSNIRRNLEHLEIANLYLFLDRSPQSSNKNLRERATEINHDLLRIGKTDPDSSARRELCGICLSVFQDDKEKEKYDNTLAVEAMDQIKEQIELAGADYLISLNELNELVRQARMRGVPAEDARAYIEDFAKKRKWGVQSEEQLPCVNMKMCGYCSTLASSSAAMHCIKCGEPLSLACPKCGSETPTQDNSCSKCGCNTGDAPVVKALLTEGQHLALQGELVEALNRFDRGLFYWPGWKPLLEERKKAENQQKAREAELQTIESLVKNGKLLEARSLLEKFARNQGAAGIHDLKKRVSDGVARAEVLTREAEAYRQAGKAEEALAKYEEALGICSDLEQAKKAIAAFPPPPPLRLDVTPLANGFRLRWLEAKGRGAITYRVLRKSQGIPTSHTDGECIEEVQGSQADDVRDVGGVPWHYAVFALRNGVPSRNSANSGPHLLTPEVEDLKAYAGDGEITLQWRPPKGCRRVEVWRRENGAPSRPGEGTLVPASENMAQDAGLTNNAQYGYLVVAVFADPAHPGKEVYASGARASVSPAPAPKPIVDLACQRENKTVTLTWTPIPGAATQIRYTTQTPQFIQGQIVSLKQIDLVGTLVPGQAQGYAQMDLQAQGAVSFLPLSVVGATAVVGKIVTITTIDDVAGLMAQSTGRSVILTWDWPPGIEEVLVCYNHDACSESPISRHSTNVRVPRQDYERTGCWELKNVLKKPHYFTVFSKSPASDSYSAGSKIWIVLGPTIAVSYRVVLKKHLLTRKVQDAWLEVSCPEGHWLPSLLVVGKQANVPLSPTDGVLILEIPAMYYEAGRKLIPLPLHQCRAGIYVKLFFSGEIEARFRLLPASKENLTLG